MIFSSLMSPIQSKSLTSTNNSPIGSARDRVAKVVLLVIFLGFNLHSTSQDRLPNQIPPSPLTMQMQKYGDFPVSHFTGVPDIKVPIYTIEEGDIKVPIYLSFHASGLNLNDNRGLIGPGWTLHTGGMQSRVINGLPDDGPYQYYRPADFTYNYGSRYQEMKDIYSKQFNDYELDIWSYNFLGRSGKYINNAYDPATNLYSFFVLQKDNFDVETGTDENGITYSFGGPGYEEYQTWYDYKREWDYDAVSTWHLKSIISSRHPGMGVNYQYQDGPSYNLGEFSWQYKLDDHYDALMDCGSTPDPETCNISPYFPYSHYNGNQYLSTSSGRTYNTRVPQRITFSGGYLLFFLNSQKYLDRIEIFNSSDQLLKKVEFLATESAFIPNQFNSRILNDVVLKDANNIEQERYSFTYYYAGTNFSLSKDHWGFYNGRPRDGHGDLIGIPNFHSFWSDVHGTHNQTYTAGGTADREPNALAAMSMMLKTLTYPTKGYTEFLYEGNRDAANRPTGGIRIKDIISYTAQNEIASHKSYTYGGGHCEYYPTTDLYLQHDAVATENYDGRRTTISEHSPIPLSPKGSSVTYNQVTESEGEKTTIYMYDTNNAYTYERLDNPYYSITGESNPQFKLFANNYKPWTYGSLIYKKILSPGYERVELYNYQDSLLNTIHDLVMTQRLFPIRTGGYYSDQESMEQDFHSRYSLYAFANRYHHSGLKRQIGTSIKEKWSNGQEITTDEEYEYGNASYPLQKTAVKTTDSKGQSIRTTYKYPYDYPSDPVYQDMTQKRRIGSPVEEVQINVTLNKELKKISRDHSLFNTSSPQISAIRASAGGAALETEVTADRYDSRGHILQQTDKDGLVTSFIFGYGQLYPVAQIVGADYNTAIALVTPSVLDNSSTSETDLRNHLSALRTGLPNAQVTTYTYKSLVGMTSMTDPRGQTTRYEYDNFQRLSTIKDHNGDIVKQYCYNYAGQQTPCYPITVPVTVSSGGGGSTSTIGAWGEFENPTSTNGYNGDYYYSYEFADLYFRFYSNPSNWTPYTLTSGLNLNYSVSSVYSYNWGSDAPSFFNWTLPISAGGNSYNYGNVELIYYEEWAWDPDWGYLYDCYLYDYQVTPGTGYENGATTWN